MKAFIKRKPRSTQMQGDILTQLVLPLGLAFIMFSLGVGLTLDDFKRVFTHPRAFAVGVVCHFVLLPLVGYLVIKGWGVTGALAVGFMIIAACPTGTTSNLLTYYARGDVALALSFTAIAGVVSIVTVPFILGWSLQHFLGATQTVNLPVGQVMGQIFVVMGLPVAIGMLLRAKAERWALRWQGKLGTLSALIFVAIITASIIKHIDLFKANFSTLAPLVLTMNFVMLAIGFGLSKLARVETRQAITVAIESSVQNGTLAIVIGSTILKNDLMMLPGAIYGVAMYFTGIAFVFVARRFLK
jgi:bile acid:Na+ symporter, BASS family